MKYVCKYANTDTPDYTRPFMTGVVAFWNVLPENRHALQLVGAAA